MQIKHPHIKECVLPSAPPPLQEALGSDVQIHIVLVICDLEGYSLTCECLQKTVVGRYLSVWGTCTNLQHYVCMHACRSAFHNYSLRSPGAFMPHPSDMVACAIVYCNLALIYSCSITLYCKCRQMCRLMSVLVCIIKRQVFLSG